MVAALAALIVTGATTLSPPHALSGGGTRAAASRHSSALRCAHRSDCTALRRLQATAAPAPGPTTPATSISPTTPTSATPSTTSSAAATTAPPVVVGYAASDEVIANPERGFTHYTETRWSSDGSAYTPLDVSTLKAWRTTDSVTVVYRIYYLGGLVDRDVIDPGFLRAVAADLGTARTAGVKLVVRFAYSPDDGRDAPPARAIGHIRQLAPVLNAASDVILSLQAGFIGRWGEWYYSDSYTSDPTRPYALTDADWTRRGQVLQALLDATSPGIFVQVRYPSIVSHLVRSADVARVGIHDDCFLASDTDMGTFPTSAEEAWLAGASATVPVGGETCGEDGARSQWGTAATELARYHWSFLNADFDRAVLYSWGQVGMATAARSLGYRLRLVSGAFPVTAQPGQTVQIGLTLTNDGYAAPLAKRPVQVVFRSGTTAVAVPVAVDVRSLAAGATRTFSVDVPVPATPGAWALALALPDRAASLVANPAYAVQLANQGLWDPATGRNDLRHTLVVG